MIRTIEFCYVTAIRINISEILSIVQSSIGVMGVEAEEGQN